MKFSLFLILLGCCLALLLNNPISYQFDNQPIIRSYDLSQLFGLIVFVLFILFLFRKK